jgi:archaemetzincin
VPQAVRILSAHRQTAGERDGLAALVGSRFGVAARCLPAELDLARAHDASRRQYNAAALMAQVADLAGAAGDKCIAVVDVDLFIPVLTFVFGQAVLGGAAGVISTHRLANEFYGLPRDDRVFRERIEKEVVHELGHMFGLYHCRQFECVMRSSTYVEEIDLKRSTFCADCQALLSAPAPPGAG